MPSVKPPHLQFTVHGVLGAVGFFTVPKSASEPGRSADHDYGIIASWRFSAPDDAPSDASLLPIDGKALQPHTSS